MVAAANNIHSGNTDPDHIFRIYVVFPSPIRASRVPDYHTNTGHVFISLAEPDKDEQFLGFNAAFQVLGREGFSPEDLIHGVRDAFKPVQGIVSDESRYMRAVHDVMDYLITPEQFQKIQNRIDHWRNEKPDYILALRNCVSFACDRRAQAPRPDFGPAYTAWHRIGHNTGQMASKPFAGPPDCGTVR